ncbi:MAG: hypothetical protein IJX88_05290 [Clostridia bacterium]|nr:hypothetical protein [Clostridia bacterium]
MAGNKGKKGLSPKAKKWLTGIGIGVAVVVACGFGIKLSKLDKTNDVSSTFGYERGLLDSEGKEVKGTTSIRTKDMVGIDGLVCDLKTDASVTYKVFFYDKDEKFLSSTDELNEDFSATTGTVAEGAKYARILITPLNDPEVSVTEIAGYAAELTVEWSK